MFLSLLVKIHVVTSGETFGAHNDLLNQLGKKLVLLPTDRQRKSITMLFCPITSRVGSDVEAAMSSVLGDQNVILVLMHHSRDETYSTAGTDWSEMYPNITLSVHVLFHETVPGLLPCSKNKKAVDKMQEVLTKHSSICWARTRRKILVGIAVISVYTYLKFFRST